jgi:hypothetical protein
MGIRARLVFTSMILRSSLWSDLKAQKRNGQDNKAD